MSRYYDKDKLKRQLEPEQIFELLEIWGGEPRQQDKCIISSTICHNLPGCGSHKLYYYKNTQLFICFTGCDSSFDVFELCIKVMKIQKGEDWKLYDAMDYIASYFGFQGEEKKEELTKPELKDWEIFRKHDIQFKKRYSETIPLKIYDFAILNKFSYPRIKRWEDEGILPEVSRENLIGYYPGAEQIVIPHFDIENNLIGIRGRTLIQSEEKRLGKYRPIKLGDTIYSHPLSLNLYHLNKSKETIKVAKAAIIFESEKATLLSESFYGDSDISCACCGQNLSEYQICLLKSLGVNELIIGFDRDYETIGDENFQKFKRKLLSIAERYSQTIKISAIVDKRNRLPIHSSPIDIGKETFELLLKERIELR